MIRAILFFLIVMAVSVSIVFVLPAVSRKELDRKLIMKVILTLAVAAVLFVYQQWLIRNRDPAGCLRAFVNNQYVGMAIFIGILLQYVYAAQ